MSSYINIPPSLGPQPGPISTQRARALGLLGLSVSDPTTGEFFDDFASATSATVISAWNISAGGSGALATQVSATGAGVIQQSTGATAGSKLDLLGLVGQVANVTTTKSYISGRMRLQTVVDAAAIEFMGWINQAQDHTIGFGFNGALSAVNFGVQYDGIIAGTNLDLGVAVDQSFHTFELWTLGDSKLHATIDGGPDKGPVTMAGAPVNFLYPFITIRNGATAAIRIQQPDWFYAMFQRS